MNGPTLTNAKFRAVTFAIQVAAILTFYVPALFIGGGVHPLWLLAGVVNTGIFAAIFYRDARTRTALSVLLMIVSLIGTGVLGAFGTMGLLFAELGYTLSPLIAAHIWFANMAAIFALAAPRRWG